MSCKIYVKNGYVHEVTNALIGGTAKFGCQDWKDKATHVPVVCTSNKETHATWTQMDGSELPSCGTPVHQGMIIWYCLTIEQLLKAVKVSGECNKDNDCLPWQKCEKTQNKCVHRECPMPEHDEKMLIAHDDRFVGVERSIRLRCPLGHLVNGLHDEITLSCSLLSARPKNESTPSYSCQKGNFLSYFCLPASVLICCLL